MSTIYTFHTECSTMDTLASGDEFLVYDASTGRTVSATPSDIATFIGSNPGTQTGGTYVNPTFTGATVYSATASASFLVGTTLTARIGFYGKAGTSQPAAAAQAQLTITYNNPSTCTGVVGFSTTAHMQDALGLLMQIRTTLVDNGLMKGSA